jgi:hypothetical protein
VPVSVVGIATGYGLDGPGIESSLLRDTEEEGSCECCRTVSVASVACLKVE